MTDPKIPGGYYIKARVIQESSIMNQPPHVREIWDYVLMNANHADATLSGGRKIKRGQLFRRYKQIREDLSWTVGWRKEMYNENHVKKAMKFLREALMIDTTKEPGGVLITVLNYDKYQNPKNYERTKEGTSERTNEEPLQNQSVPTYDKKKEELKEEEINIGGSFGSNMGNPGFRINYGQHSPLYGSYMGISGDSASFSQKDISGELSETDNNGIDSHNCNFDTDYQEGRPCGGRTQASINGGRKEIESAEQEVQGVLNGKPNGNFSYNDSNNIDNGSKHLPDTGKLGKVDISENLKNGGLNAQNIKPDNIDSHSTGYMGNSNVLGADPESVKGVHPLLGGSNSMHSVDNLFNEKSSGSFPNTGGGRRNSSRGMDNSNGEVGNASNMETPKDDQPEQVKPKKAKKKNGTAIQLDFSGIDESINLDVLKEFIDYRKTDKKNPVKTQRTLNGIVNAALNCKQEYGYNPNHVLLYAMQAGSNGWQSPRPDFLASCQLDFKRFSQRLNGNNISQFNNKCNECMEEFICQKDKTKKCGEFKKRPYMSELELKNFRNAAEATRLIKEGLI